VLLLSSWNEAKPHPYIFFTLQLGHESYMVAIW